MSATHLPSGLSPDAVDALTELNAIITRLRNTHQQSASQGTTTGGPSTTGLTGTPIPTSAATPSNNNNKPTTGSTTTGNTPGADPNLLTVKDLPAATDNLKHKLQRARVAMRGLADVQRSIGQQEAELRALEGRLARQAARLASTQEDGMRFVESEGARRRGEEEEALGRMVE